MEKFIGQNIKGLLCKITEQNGAVKHEDFTMFDGTIVGYDPKFDNFIVVFENQGDILSAKRVYPASEVLNQLT